MKRKILTTHSRTSELRYQISEETAQLIEEHVEDVVKEDEGFSDITDDPTVLDMEVLQAPASPTFTITFGLGSLAHSTSSPISTLAITTSTTAPGTSSLGFDTYSMAPSTSTLSSRTSTWLLEHPVWALEHSPRLLAHPTFSWLCCSRALHCLQPSPRLKSLFRRQEC